MDVCVINSLSAVLSMMCRKIIGVELSIEPVALQSA